MITPTNQSKNNIVPSTVPKSGYTLWGDAHIGWGDTLGYWGGPVAGVTNQSKNTITPTNTPKS